MNLVASMMVLFSVLVPGKIWYAPDQAIAVKVESKEPVTLVLQDFSGRTFDPTTSAEAKPGDTVDVRSLFPTLGKEGTYVLFAVPKGKPLTEFVGTPVVFEALKSPSFSGPISTTVIKAMPLCYAEIETQQGVMKAIFWYDVAPNTVSSFLSLAQTEFYDGLTFHRIVPGFVVQGGDPTGTGFGGPGYTLAAEFNDRPHDVGVLSMARTGDPLEGKGIKPRSEFANSAGSQFFICLSREKTEALDRRYTGFGQLVEGVDVLNKIAASPVKNPSSGKPVTPPVMKAIRVVAVTSAQNPYTALLKLEATSFGRAGAATSAPTTAESK